jgi:phospholipid-transporting ATPase
VLKQHLRNGGIPGVLPLFARALGLCHAAIPSLDEKSGVLVYESQSPDESALLNGMRENGMALLSRNKTQLTVENSLDGRGEEVYELLSTQEFSSDRKRMSVVVRVGSEIHLYVKGADNIVIERLDKAAAANSPDKLDDVLERLRDFSVLGLRTLCVAYRVLSEAEYAAFQKEMDVAEVQLEGREEAIAAVAEKIETGLILLGCTAIEDRLQDEVPETIEFMLRVSLLMRYLVSNCRWGSACGC